MNIKTLNSTQRGLESTIHDMYIICICVCVYIYM